MPPAPPSGLTNADLYKQIDNLRNENFSLKQKQRELIRTLNELKIENDSLVQNADSEIKRMTEFIDKFTNEIEQSKQQLVDDYEERIVQERRQSDELKNKFYHA